MHLHHGKLCVLHTFELKDENVQYMKCILGTHYFALPHVKLGVIRQRKLDC